MSEATSPKPTGPSIPASTITLTPSPTTIVTTDRVTFTTILTCSNPIQTPPAPPAPPPPPPNPPMTSLTDTNFIIILSITGATFLLLLILAIIAFCLFQKRRRNQRHTQRPQTNDTETREMTNPSPALTSFPLPPATPRLPAPPPPLQTTSDFPTSSPLFQTSTDTVGERMQPLTAPPTRPSRSASTPFLGSEYENKLFTSSQSPSRPSQVQFQKSTSPPPLPLTTFGNPLPPTFKPTTSNLTISPQIAAAFTDTTWKLPSLPTPTTNPTPRKTSTPTGSTPVPRFTEEETQIGEIEAVGSWFGIPRASTSEVNIGGDEHRETFDFFRFPASLGGQAAGGTRASSGVFPDERERERENRREGREAG